MKLKNNIKNLFTKLILFFRLSNYCFEHSRLNLLNKTKSVIGKFKPIESTETLVNSLTHHIKIDKSKTQLTNKASLLDDNEEIDVVTPAVNPFADVNALDINNAGKTILDYASDSSTDDENPTLSNTWRCYEMDNSDNESTDSQYEDLLKHAGIYTIEEATLITKEKMQRLQDLYIDQFQRLQYVLREKRRQFLVSIKKEKETLSSIHEQARDSPRERKLYEKLKALNHYHKRFGVESLLHRQYMDKRLKHDAAGSTNKNVPKCIYTEGGVKCGERSMPCCKFCRKHILEDKKQVLFKACGIEKSSIVCQEPVVNILEDSTCILHTFLPSPKVYTRRKYESETEDELMDPKLEIKEEYLDDEVLTDTTSAHVEECLAPDALIEGDNITIIHGESMDVQSSDNVEISVD